MKPPAKASSDHLKIVANADKSLESAYHQLAQREGAISRLTTQLLSLERSEHERQSIEEALQAGLASLTASINEKNATIQLTSGTRFFDQEQRCLEKLERDFAVSLKDANSRQAELAKARRHDDLVREQFTKDLERERSQKAMLHKKIASLEQAKQQALENHGQELFKLFSLKWKHIADERAAANATLRSLAEQEQALLAESSTQLQQYPELHHRLISDNTVYSDDVSMLFDAALAYRKAVETAQPIRQFVDAIRSEKPFMASWLVIDPWVLRPDYEVYTNQDLEAWLDSYRNQRGK